MQLQTFHHVELLDNIWPCPAIRETAVLSENAEYKQFKTASNTHFKKKCTFLVPNDIFFSIKKTQQQMNKDVPQINPK